MADKTADTTFYNQLQLHRKVVLGIVIATAADTVDFANKINTIQAVRVSVAATGAMIDDNSFTGTVVTIGTGPSAEGVLIEAIGY